MDRESRRYPPVYEKLVPTALVAISLAVLVLLAIIFAAGLGYLS